MFTFYNALGLMLLVALTITRFFYCNHPEAESHKWQRNNFRAIFSLVLFLLLLLFEWSHRNQAWPLASVNEQVGRGQSVNLVAYDIVFFSMREYSEYIRPLGRCCLIGCKEVQSYCVLPQLHGKLLKNHPSCFVTWCL